MIAKLSVQMIFLIVIGVVLVVIGVTDIKKKRRMKKEGYLNEAKVLVSKYISKEYDDGFLMQNYYDLTLEVKENGKKEKVNIKSTDEYFAGESVKVYRDNVYRNKLNIYKGENKNIFNSLVLSVVGVLMVFVPFSTVSQQSLILALIVLLVGIYFLNSFILDKKKNLKEIPAEICGVIKFEKDSSQGRRKKMFSTKSVSYYPILEYVLDGKKRHMRSDVNSTQEKSFKVGKNVKLYRDVDTGVILEKKERISFALIGIVLILISLYGVFVSIFSLL